MRKKATSSHSKTLTIEAALPNHPFLRATLPPLSACASGFRVNRVSVSHVKTTFNNIVLGVARDTNQQRQQR